jgi:predicted AlkP superfamily phosphohydrolase/phosphomutase
MRYLRMLTNAIVGGVLGAVYLTVVVLLINPQVPLVSRTAGELFLALVSFYGLHLSVAVYLVILGREALASRPLQPGWLSVRLLAWLGAAFAAATALIIWGNLQGFRAVLGDVQADRMWTAAVAATIAALVLVGVVALRYSFGRTGTRAAGVLLTAVLVASVAVPLWVRGFGDVPVPAVPRATTRVVQENAALVDMTPRVRLILLDGASLSVIREGAAAGRLPNFGRVLDRGAVMDLATLKPTQAEPVWAAAATGKYPPQNGIRSNALFRTTAGRAPGPDAVDLLPDYCFAYALVNQGYLSPDIASSDSLRARTLWDIVAEYGVTAGIVRWPLTHPARLSRGYLISDRFHEGSSSPLRLSDPSAGVPTSAVEIAREVFDAADVGVVGGLPERWDRVYREVSAHLEAQFAPRLTAVRYQGLDALSHLYWSQAEPGQFRAPDAQGGAKILDDYYKEIDEDLGRAIERQTGNDLLLIVSGFGMDRVSLPKRALASLLREASLTGSHEGAPDGFLLAYGSQVLHAELPRGAIVDVAPTVLSYLGLPVGRDMDGFARSDLFVRAYRRDHPVSYISTHER